MPICAHSVSTAQVVHSCVVSGTQTKLSWPSMSMPLTPTQPHPAGQSPPSQNLVQLPLEPTNTQRLLSHCARSVHGSPKPFFAPSVGASAPGGASPPVEAGREDAHPTSNATSAASLIGTSVSL